MEIDKLLAGSAKALSDVHPELKKRVTILITNLNLKGLNFGAFMGLRTVEQQNGLYAQGRTLPGKKVTNAKGGQSYHNFGLAVDLVEDGDPNNAGIKWSWSNNKDYLSIGPAAKSAGLEWGGFWQSFKDFPHVQLICGLSLLQANQLYANGGIEVVWAEIDKRLKAQNT